MSPALNLRTDKYGGSFEKRMKFGKDIITGIMKKSIPGFLSGSSSAPTRKFPAESIFPLASKIAKYVAGLGVVYLHMWLPPLRPSRS